LDLFYTRKERLERVKAVDYVIV